MKFESDRRQHNENGLWLLNLVHRIADRLSPAEIRIVDMVS